jgi:NifB/MoaA-like Fe-S oxidoreductase
LLKNKKLGEVLFLPRVVLESTGKLFLDNIELEQLSKELGVEIQTICSDGYEFLYKVLGI